MPTIQSFDRLNDVNTSKMTVLSIERYFGEMRLTKQQKKERIALAKDIEDVMLFFFSMVLVMNDYAYMAAISTVDVKNTLRERLYDTVEKHMEINDDLRQHLDQYIDDVSDTTTEHMVVLVALADDETEKKAQEKKYVSDERAKLLAEEEANTLFNVTDYYKAKRLGYTKKEWVSMRDNRVRHDHMVVDGKVIPIDELFIVGNSLMRFPRDQKFGASMKQISNCRCSLRYIK